MARCSATLARVRAPAGVHGHPRLAILGLLEARLLPFDRALLAGLDEMVWPPAASTDAFLNRQMRAALGLSAPERRIGQTGHDFMAALGAPEVFVSRAKKRDGAPTVASRFLQRIDAAAGDGGLAAARRRGELYLRLARALDAAGPPAPIQRPEPKPPVELRPAKVSASPGSRPCDATPTRSMPSASSASPGSMRSAGTSTRATSAMPGMAPCRTSSNGIRPGLCRTRLAAFSSPSRASASASQLDDPFFEARVVAECRKDDRLPDRRRGPSPRRNSAIWVERRGEIVFPLGDGRTVSH